MIRRFYVHASCAATADGWLVMLDTLQLRTPGGLALVLPTEALAEGLAAEWRAQGELVRPELMPLTRLANVAVERTPHARNLLAAEVARYGETDLLHHRAEGPEELVAREAMGWDPLLEWAKASLGIQFPVVSGVIAPARNAEALLELAQAHDDYTLTALAHATTLFGSAVLAFALVRGRLSASEAFALSRIDEDFQAEHWGVDSEAAERAALLASEAEAVGDFLGRLRRR